MSIKKVLILFLVILLSIGTVLPFFRSGFFEFHDNTTVVRVYEMYKSLSYGLFPVRWVADLGYGYGYPIYNFYAPLPYYVGGILSFFGIGSLLSTKIMLLLGVITSGITMFYFSKKFFGVYGGLLSAAMYMYFPYHAVNIYVRGAVGEVYAYAFLPILFLGIYSLSVSKLNKISEYKKEIFLIAFGIFLVAMSHNLTILMTLILLVPAVIFLITFFKNKKNFLFISIFAVILGMALASFYIIPAFMEMNYTNVSSQIGGGAYFKDHFVCVSQLWESQWGFGGSVPGCLDGLSFKLGKIHLLLAGISLLLVSMSIYKRHIKNEEKIVVISFLILAISIFLTTESSLGLWANIKYMEYIQYPWRFLNFAGLFVSFLSGYLLFKFNSNSLKNITIVIVIFIILVTSVKLFTPQYFNSYKDSYYMNDEYIKFKVSKISDEYLPKGFIKPISYNEVPKEKFIQPLNGSIITIDNQPGYLKANYDVNYESLIHINTAYFPAWRATVNGQDVQILQASNGMKINIPSGKGIIELKFVQTQIEVIGNLISVFAFVLMLTVIILSKLYGKKTS